MSDITVPRADLEALETKLDAAETKQALIETGLVELQKSTGKLHETPLNRLPSAIDTLVVTEVQIAAAAAEVGNDLTDAAEMVSGMLAGEPPPEPPEPDPDLMLDLSDVDGIRPLADGALRDARCLAMVLLAKSGGHRKGVGSKSSKNKSKTNGGALGVGLWPDPAGTVEGWVGSNDAGAIAQITNGNIPAGKRRFVAFNIADATLDLQLGAVEKSIPRPAVILPADGATFLGAGAWGDEAPKDPLGGQLVRFRAWRSPKTKAERDAVMAEWASVIDPDDVVVPPGPNGPTPPDGLEPIKPGVQQTIITVDATPRQTWIGYGWGIGAPSAHEIPARLAKMQQWPDTFFKELNSQAVRLIDPHHPEFISQTKAFSDWIRSKGVDVLIGSFFYKQQGISIESCADATKAAIDAGIPLTHVIPQNEPDGGPGDPSTYPRTPDAQLAPMFKAFRARLDSHGLQRVIILGQEWAHAASGDANHEFDLLNSAGLIPNVVGHGAGHLYGDCCDQSISTDRWLKYSGIFSMETGYMAPNTAAHVISAENNGIEVEISHQSQSHQANDDDLRQKLVAANGTRQIQQYQMQITSKDLLRGSVFRLCHCSDRPNGLDARNAEFMVRRDKRNPRVAVSCAKRPDGRWLLHACVAPDPSFGGAVTHQFTVQIPELKGENGWWTARKCSGAGTVGSAPDVAMVDGWIRFTAAVQDVWSLVSA